MKKIDTFYFGEVSLRERIELNGDSHVEVIDSNGNTMTDIVGYDIDEINEDVIEEFLKN